MILLQATTLLHGLVIPRIMIRTFGSEVNGLLTSITQFLSFISLLEGGLGAVVLAELYKPIEEHNSIEITKILAASQCFFYKLALVFLCYTGILAVLYPLIINNEFSFEYTSLLVLILSITTFSQYLFSLTNRLFLQAQQKIYIVNYISSFTLVINTVIVYIIAVEYPEIHILKLISAVSFLIQPVLYQRYIEKRYRVSRNEYSKKKDNSVLKERWSGFLQNLAHFINMNTDVVVITLFLSLKDVSIYSVYMIAINALRAIITGIGNSYQSALGKYYAQNNAKQLNERFSTFETVNWAISMVLFNTCLIIVNDFVQLYTHNVVDAVYYQPGFAIVMTIANLIYCIREPYRLMILSAGKFKETNIGAAIEAILNILITILLIKKFSLLGAAIGTLIAIGYRLIYFIAFLRKSILYRRYRMYIKEMIMTIIILMVNLIFCSRVKITIDNYFAFLGYGILIVIAEMMLLAICLFVFDNGKMMRVISMIRNRKKHIRQW